MKNLNLENVKEREEFKRLTAGGYICQITKVVDAHDKEYLKIEYDIAEGDFKGHYKELFEAKSFWGGSFIRSYKESALPLFKSFTTAVENSNYGFKFNYDESKLVGKLIGLVLAEEDYKKKDGTVGTKLYVASCRTIKQIREGDFKIPEPKKLAVTAQETADYMQMLSATEELPF